jgi:hypothetical protein
MDKRSLSSDELGILFFLASIILGSWFRLFPLLTAGFPINDGGLFYVMIKAIQENGYRLPEHVFYNGLDIPLAYPPLGFYISGLFADLLQVELLKVLQWLPAFVLIATIPAVFYLANLLLKSRLKAGLAAMLYSLLPRSISWLIMGGGITRSFGQLFLILATIQIYLLFTTNHKKHLFYSILFSSLVVLTHPEATIHTLAIGLTLWGLFGRSKANTVSTFLIAGATLLVTMPWWAVMLTRFGFSPYLSASQTGFHGAGYLLAFIMPFSQEVFIPLVAVLAIIGGIYLIARKDYLVPLLYAVPFFVEPRNAPNVSVIFMAMLASVALCDLILPVLSKVSGELNNKIHTRLFSSLPEKILIVLLVISLILGMQLFGMELSQKHVSNDTLHAFEWVISHTNEESRYLVLTGETAALEDFTNEWFPALANRVSVTTLQGLEWKDPAGFTERITALEDIQRCRFNQNILKCTESFARRSNLEFDYLFVLRKSINPSIQYLDTPAWDEKSQYEIVYTSNDVFIIKRFGRNSDASISKNRFTDQAASVTN